MKPAPRPSTRELGSQTGPPNATFNIVLSVLLAVALMLMIVALNYRFEQSTSRIIKIVLGIGAVGLIVMNPRVGLFLFVVAAPFLGWLPKLPVPGFNTLNAFLFLLFMPFALSRVLNRQRIFPPMRLAVPIGVFLLVLFLGWVRGTVFPVGYVYDAGKTGLELFRFSVGFLPYFVGLAMLHEGGLRRPMAWALMLGVAAESVATIMLGGTGRGGRALGTMGQPNDLGAYLAMYTVFAAAFLTGVGFWQRIVVAAIVAAGSYGVLLTISRGALVALAVGLVVVSVRSSRFLTILILLAAATSPIWTPENVKERVTSTRVEAEDADDSEFEPSAQLRINTWKTILAIAADHPLDGVGFVGLPYVLKETAAKLGFTPVVNSAHNTFFRMLGDHGIPGLVVLVFLLWRMLKLSEDGVRLARNRFDRQIGIGMGSAVLTIAIASWFGDRIFRVDLIAGLWIGFGLLDDMCLEHSGGKS